MSKFYQTKKFKKLQDRWYKKLDKSGFDDIEYDEEKLSEYSVRFLRHPHYVWELKAAYYTMCETFLNNYQFDSLHEKSIWEDHVKGLGTRAIAKKLSKGKRKQINHITIWKVVSRLHDIMRVGYLTDLEDDEYYN